MTRASSVTSDLARTASHELRALAAVMRPDWDPDALSGAMTACHTAGWSWPVTFKKVAEMLTDDRAQPYQLRDAARHPTERQVTGPDVYERGAAMAKSELARTLIERDLAAEAEPAGDVTGVPGDAG